MPTMEIYRPLCKRCISPAHWMMPALMLGVWMHKASHTPRQDGIWFSVQLQSERRRIMKTMSQVKPQNHLDPNLSVADDGVVGVSSRSSSVSLPLPGICWLRLTTKGLRFINGWIVAPHLLNLVSGPIDAIRISIAIVICSGQINC